MAEGANGEYEPQRTPLAAALHGVLREFSRNRTTENYLFVNNTVKQADISAYLPRFANCICRCNIISHSSNALAGARLDCSRSPSGAGKQGSVL